MATAILPAPHLSPERLAWVGLAASTLAVASWASMARPPILLYSAAGFSPEDLKAWVAAIAASVGSLCMAANLVLGVYHRWFGPARPRKPRRKKDDKGPRPDAPPLPVPA